MKIRASHGYTLVELLVVVGIISILISLSLVGVNSARVRSRDAKRIADLQTIQSALEQHAFRNSQIPYPPETTNDPLALEYCNGSREIGIYSNSCFKQVLGIVPVDPKGAQYQYSRPACLTNGTNGSTRLLGSAQGITDQASCTANGGRVFSPSYGLHTLLEATNSPQGKSDSSPGDAISYDLLP